MCVYENSRKKVEKESLNSGKFTSLVLHNIIQIIS